MPRLVLAGGETGVVVQTATSFDGNLFRNFATPLLGTSMHPLLTMFEQERPHRSFASEPVDPAEKLFVVGLAAGEVPDRSPA